MCRGHGEGYSRENCLVETVTQETHMHVHTYKHTINTHAHTNSPPHTTHYVEYTKSLSALDLIVETAKTLICAPCASVRLPEKTTFTALTAL